MLSSLVLLAFLAFPGLIILLMLLEWRKQVTWTPATGIVTHVRTRTSNHDSPTSSYLVVTYEYRDHHGQVHRGEGPLGRQEVRLDGEAPAIELRMDPRDPSRSVVADPSSGTGA